MNALLHRTYLIGLLSYAFGWTALFAILGGVFSQGTSYLPIFLVAAALLFLIAFLRVRHGYRQPEEAQYVRTRYVLAGFLVIFFSIPFALGLGLTHPLYPTAALLVGGVPLWILMMQIIDNPGYIRQLMLEHYRYEVIALVAVAFIAAVLQGDPLWQSKMLPYLVGYLLTRLMALSYASQLQRGQTKNSRLLQFQNNLPFVVVGLALFAGWILNAAGLPVFALIGAVIKWLISPLMTLLAYLGEFLYSFFGLENLFPPNEVEEPYEPASMEDDQEGVVGDYKLVRLFLFSGLLAAVLFVLILYLRRNNRMLKTRFRTSLVEMREFIRMDTDKKRNKKRKVDLSALTRMRKAYRRFLLTMKRAGHLRTPDETAAEYIGKIAAGSPDLNVPMRELTDLYMQERYGGRTVNIDHAERLANDLLKNK